MWMSCGGDTERRRREEKAEEEKKQRRRVGNKKLQPHTEMWGILNSSIILFSI